MFQREFDREIPLDEQLQGVSLILMEALFRVRRDGLPPRPPRTNTPPSSPAPPASALPRPKRTVPKSRHAKQKPGTYANRLRNLFRKREREKTRFWLEQVVSIRNVPCDQLDRAVCHIHQATLDLEFREAFDHAMRTLSAGERRIASLVSEHGITHAAREMQVSWRQIGNVLVSMRAVFEKAGFDSTARPVPRHVLSHQGEANGFAVR